MAIILYTVDYWKLNADEPSSEICQGPRWRNSCGGDEL
jgi:hypothetical protein